MAEAESLNTIVGNFGLSSLSRHVESQSGPSELTPELFKMDELHGGKHDNV